MATLARIKLILQPLVVWVGKCCLVLFRTKIVLPSCVHREQLREAIFYTKLREELHGRSFQFSPSIIFLVDLKVFFMGNPEQRWMPFFKNHYIISMKIYGVERKTERGGGKFNQTLCFCTCCCCFPVVSYFCQCFFSRFYLVEKFWLWKYGKFRKLRNWWKALNGRVLKSF